MAHRGTGQESYEGAILAAMLPTSFHFRYSWISKGRLGGCFAASPFVSRFLGLMERRKTILFSMRDRAETSPSRDVRVLCEWFQQPTISHIPKHKAVKNSWRYSNGHDELASVIVWVEQMSALLRESQEAKKVDYAELRETLEALTETDFPTLLLWSKTALAKRLFEVKDVGQKTIKLTERFQMNDHAFVQAVNVSLGYLFSGVGRLSPRDGWVGIGFGGFKEGAPDLPLHIGDMTERFKLEPDLAWMNRHWSDLTPLALDPGLDAWTYLARRISRQKNAGIQAKYSRILDGLRAQATAVEGDPLNFEKVKEFLGSAERVLRTSVSEIDWQENPHRWWLKRLFPTEMSLSPKAGLSFLKLFENMNRNLRRKRQTARKRIPYSIAMKRLHPESILLEAQNFVDWIVEPANAQRLIPAGLRSGCALVFWGEPSGFRFHYVEPNPRRPAERFAVNFPEIPAYCTDSSDRAFAPLKPPAHLIDNRLLRLRCPEREKALETLAPNDESSFYSTFVVEDTVPLLEKELQSSRYENIPDNMPILVSPRDKIVLTFGALYPSSKVWILSPADVREFCRRTHKAEELAAYYLLEVHELLGSPLWLDWMSQGKRSSMPTHSLVAWFHILHVFRRAEAGIAFLNPQIDSSSIVLSDNKGAALTSQILIRYQ